MIIRYKGHFEQVMLVGNSGKILHRFDLNVSPNNTGMETVFWNGKNKPVLLYNGGMLWKGDGSRSFKLPGLPPEQGSKRQGWYHCIPANLTGDTREEVVVYNPWATEIFIYTQQDLRMKKYNGYKATARQYNVRLMD